MDYENVKTGEWLRMNRLYLKKSLRYFAEKMFTTKQRLSNVERGESTKSTAQHYTIVMREELKRHNKEPLDI